MEAGTAAELLKDVRRRAGLSQSELARRTGVAQSVISAYERGRREPGVDTLDRILSAAGYRLSLRGRPNEELAALLLRQLLGLVDALPPTRRTTLEYPRLPAERTS